MDEPSIRRRLGAEIVGTAFLLCAIVGSGIMGEKLAGGNGAVALLANALATAGALYCLIVLFGRMSGAHFNPVVSLSLYFNGELTLRDTALYALAQCVGGVAGVVAAHAMFGLDLLQLSQTSRTGPSQWIAEIIATLGLLLVIHGLKRERPEAIPQSVALYILSAYWFTASTSFANPAVTLARTLTNTFAGIAPAHAPTFILAQIIGLALALGLIRFFWPDHRATSR